MGSLSRFSPRVAARFCLAGALGLGLVAAARAQVAAPGDTALSIIDAHSQIRGSVDPDDVVRLLREAGVSRAILSWRYPWFSSRGGKTDGALELARKHPGLIIPAIGTKGAEYLDNRPAWHDIMRREGAKDGFRAMAELHIYHEEKGRNAPEVFVMPGDGRIATALDIARARGWPLILHIEAARLERGRRERIFGDLAALMEKNPDQAFVLIHMAQLRPESIAALIGAYPNVHFITSNTNLIARFRGNAHDFLNIFEGDEGPELQAKWRDLLLAHPDRFILGFDNVNPNHWSDIYVRQVALWRNVLMKMPRAAAEAIAYRNAERLWNLPPLAP